MLEKFILGDDDKATNAEKDMEIQDILKLFPDKNITKKQNNSLIFKTLKYL